MSPKEAQDVKTQDTGPRSPRFIQKEWFQWAQTPTSSHTQKSSRFLNLGYLVFFNSQKYFWCSDDLPFVADSYTTWLLSLPSENSFLRVTWDAVSQVWSPKNFHQIKHNSQLLGWDSFLSRQYPACIPDLDPESHLYIAARVISLPCTSAHSNVLFKFL